MRFEHVGQTYQMIRAGDLDRNGMGLKLHLGDRAVAEVFYSDVTKEFTISVFEPALPLEVIERLITAARVGLLPEKQAHGF